MSTHKTREVRNTLTSDSKRQRQPRRFRRVLLPLLLAYCVLPISGGGNDDIIQQVQDGTDVAVGYDHLGPGPHTLTMTLQATGAGNELYNSWVWDPSGQIIWTSNDATQQQLEHHWQAVGVMGGDVLTPQFEGNTTVGGGGDPTLTYFRVSVSHVDMDLDPGPAGGGDPVYWDDETESSTGVGIPVTHNNATLPATFPIEDTTGRQLTLWVGSEHGGTLQFEGTGTSLAVYRVGAGSWEKVTAGITVPPGGMFETFLVHTSNQFTGFQTLTARLQHSTTALDAADTVKLVFQNDPVPPPDPLLDIDVDSDNDNTATQHRPPSRTQAEDDVENTPGMTMTDGEGWAKIEVHATIPSSGYLTIHADNPASGFEFADSSFNVLSSSFLFDGAVSETTVFPMVFYVRPKAGVVFNGESISVTAEYYDDAATAYSFDVVNVTFQGTQPLLDVDVDSDNDNLATQYRPPSRSQAEDDVEDTPGMTMTNGEGWAKIEVHATIPASGQLSIFTDNSSGFEFADSNFNVLTGSTLFAGPVDQTTTFPMVFYVRPTTFAFDGEEANLLTEFYEDSATNYAMDTVKVVYQGLPPAAADLDVDVDSDNDNVATQYRPPSRSAAEDEVEETPAMAMTEGEGWAKIEVHAAIPASGWLTIESDNLGGGFEFADSGFNVLTGQFLFDGPVDSTTTFPMVFYIRPKAGVPYDGEMVSITAVYYDDMATIYDQDVVNVVFRAAVTPSVDLAIDSNNDDVIDAQDAAIEDDASEPGKLLFVNHDDEDGDGIPDYADLDVQGGDDELVPIKLKIENVTNFSQVTVTFTFAGTVPTAQQFAGNDIGGGYRDYTTCKLGTVRIWNIRTADETRTLEKLIQPGVAYNASDFGFSQATTEVTFYVEAVNSGAGTIAAQIDAPFIAAVPPSDSVIKTAVAPNIGFNNANDNNDTNDLANGMPDVTFDINDYDEKIEDQKDGFQWWWRSTRQEVVDEDATEQGTPDQGGITPQTLMDAVPFKIDVPQVLLDKGYKCYLVTNGLVPGQEIRIYSNPGLGGDGGGRIDHVNFESTAQQLIDSTPIAILTDATPKLITMTSPTIELVAVFKKGNALPDFTEKIGIAIAKTAPAPLTAKLRDTIKAIVKDITKFWAEYNCRESKPSRAYPKNGGKYPLDGMRTADGMKVFRKATRKAGTKDVAKHKNFIVFVHGYNQNEKRARIYANILFRRLFLGLGFRGGFIGFLWNGDRASPPAALKKIIEIPALFDPNVENAIHTGYCLQELIKDTVLPWAGDATKIDILSHSLGNLVTWEAARLQERLHPGSAFSGNYMMVEAAVWKEAFRPQADKVYAAPNATTYTVDKLERHSWSHWFNQTGSQAGKAFSNIHNSYTPKDNALDFAMRGNDWLLRGYLLPGINTLPAKHYTRALYFGSNLLWGDPGDPLLPTTNPYHRSTIRQIKSLIQPLEKPHRLDKVPALMITRRKKIAGILALDPFGKKVVPLPVTGYQYTDLHQPIGMLALGTAPKPPNWVEDFNTQAGAGTGWREKEHSDAWVLPYLKAGAGDFIQKWYVNFVKPKIAIGKK